MEYFSVVIFYQLVTTGEAGQLSGGLTNAQIRNASIVNSLYQLRLGICEVATLKDII